MEVVRSGMAIRGHGMNNNNRYSSTLVPVHPLAEIVVAVLPAFVFSFISYVASGLLRAHDVYG